MVTSTRESSTQISILRFGPVWLIFALFAGALQGCASNAAQPVTTVFVVRHAEKSASPARDPVLTSAGRQRAATLATLFKDADIDAVYATQFQRTQATVKPLAAMLGLAVTVWDARDVDGLTAHVRTVNRGQTVIIAAHSNTVPELVIGLGGNATPIMEDEYDNLFIVIVGPMAPQTIRLHYGGR